MHLSVNYGTGHPQDSDRGTSNHIRDSDNSFRHSDINNGRNNRSFGGDSVSEGSWQVGGSDRNISLSDFLGSSWWATQISH